MAARSALFDNVDPRLARLIESFKYDKYGVTPTSGYRKGDSRQHGGVALGRTKDNPLDYATAMDVQLTDPATGKALANYQDPTTFGAYQQYANALYQHALQTDPELAKQLRWGGYFSGDKGKYGALDLMHFDVGGGAMGGGSWEGGLNPDQAKIWNLQTGGGVGGAGGAQQGPTAGTQVQQFTPQQRRDAIASIESAGSGDYNALGIWVGDPAEGRDRAYGRYQMMGKNIPVWSKAVLGRAMTPQEFLADPKAQDAIFDKIFGDYVAKHGEGNAAQAWFGGEGSIGKTDKQDPLGTSVGSYANKYLTALGKPAGDTSNPGAETYQPGGSEAPTDPVTTAGVDKTKSSFGDTLGDMFSGMGTIAGGGKDGLPKIQPLKQLQAPANVTAEGGPLASNAMSKQLADQYRQALAQLQNQAPPPQAPSGNPWRLF